MDTWADALRHCNLRLVLGRLAAGKQHTGDCRLTWADGVADVVDTEWELQLVREAAEEGTDAAEVAVTLAVGAGELVVAAEKAAGLVAAVGEGEAGFAGGEEFADAGKLAVVRLAPEPRRVEADVDRVGEEQMLCERLVGHERWVARVLVACQHESRCSPVTRCLPSEADERRKTKLKAVSRLQQHFVV